MMVVSTIPLINSFKAMQKIVYEFADTIRMCHDVKVILICTAQEFNFLMYLDISIFFQDF